MARISEEVAQFCSLGHVGARSRYCFIRALNADQNLSLQSYKELVNADNVSWNPTSLAKKPVHPLRRLRLVILTYVNYSNHCDIAIYLGNRKGCGAGRMLLVSFVDQFRISKLDLLGAGA